MSRAEKLRELAEQEQALMREIYGFDAGVKWAEERIIKLLDAQVFVTTVFNWWNEIAKPNLHEGSLWEAEVESLSDSLKALIKGEAK